MNGCKRRHHSCLHEDVVEPKNGYSPKGVAPILNCRANEVSTDKLFKILPVSLFRPCSEMQTYAMFDEGSSITIMENSIASALGLKGKVDQLTLQWFGDKVTNEKASKSFS